MSYHEVPITVTDAMTNNLEANIDIVLNTFSVFHITEDELKVLQMMGPKRYSFSVEAFQQARLFPNELFRNRDLASFTLVKTNFEKLTPVYKKFLKAHESFTTVMKVLGANTYTFGRATYDALNGSQNDDVPGIDAARKAMSYFYKGQGLQADAPEDNGAPFLPGNNPDAGGGAGGGANPT